MTKEIPPKTNELAPQENELKTNLENELVLKDQSEEKKENIDELIESVKTELDKKYETLQQNIADGKTKTQYHGISVPTKNEKKSWWKAAILGLSGILFATGAKANSPSAEDTLSRGETKERTIKAKTSLPEKKNTVSFSEGKKESLTIREVTPQERNEWNDFLSFVEQKGYKGSKELDKGSDKLARSLFAEYKTLHPETTLDYSIVASVQKDMQDLRENVQAFAKRRNDPNAENLMKNISKIDGWFGSQTSQYGYPQMVLTTYHNDALVGSENLGVVDKNMNPEKKSTIQKTQKIPKGAKVEKLKDGDYYENEDGDLVKIR